MPMSEAKQLRLMELTLQMEEKLEMVRLKWFFANYEKIFLDPFRPTNITPQNAADLFRKISDLRKKQYERERAHRAENERLDREARDAMLAQRKTFDERYKLEKEIMRPIDPDVRQILYNGVSKAGEGKYLYLKTRNNLAPYQRYFRKITTSQAYGWKVEERAGRPCKKFNRLPVIEGSFYRRFGAIRPESIYKTPPFSSGQVTVDVL